MRDAATPITALGATPEPPCTQTPASPRPTDADALRITQDVLAHVLGLDSTPAPDARLRLDLAMSSYAMMETAVLLEERLGSQADFGKIARAQTVEELARAW